MLDLYFEPLNTKQNVMVKWRCCTLLKGWSWWMVISHLTTSTHTTHWPTETLYIGQAACVPSADSPLLPCRLSFTRALHWLAQQPQQDSIKPCASCVIPTSCTQGRECSGVFVCWGRPVSSPVPVSQQSHTGKPKNIQLWVHGNQGNFLRIKPQRLAACFYQTAGPTETTTTNRAHSGAVCNMNIRWQFFSR